MTSKAQKSRGSQIAVRNPIKKILAFIPVVVPGIYLTILRGMSVAKTVEVKAFTYNPKNRIFRKQICFRSNDYVFLSVRGTNIGVSGTQNSLRVFRLHFSAQRCF